MAVKPAPRSARGRSRAPRLAANRRLDVTRAEFNRVLDQLNERGTILAGLLHNQEIQFRRIAQLQAEIDELRRAIARTRRP